MIEPESRFLSNGLEIPSELIATVANWWIPDELTPGWIDGLSDTVRELGDKWDITFDPNIPKSNVTLVLLGHSTKLGPVVFKSSPIEAEFRAESAALHIAGGGILSRLYDVDFRRSAMIVERIVPGIPLLDANLPDDEATTIAATLAKQLWCEVAEPPALHPLSIWTHDLYEWTSRPERIPDAIVELAQRIGEELLNGEVSPRLIHGDLHHQNILQRKSGDWAVIDPKGIYGDPAFEIAAWMYNPPEIALHHDYADLARRRFAICSEIWGVDRRHLIRWAFVGSVLSAVWSASGTAPGEWWQGSLKVAQALQTMLD